MRVENESNLAAVGEHWQGAARGLDSFICVFGEVGVGAGIFIDGELFRGAHGYGGEFGHITVDSSGPLCGCGATGCLETLRRPGGNCRAGRHPGRSRWQDA